MFYLVRLDRDADNNLVETPLPDYGTFEKGADAAKASKTAAATTGAKVQCRRIAQAGDWRAAMQKRMESGELTPLPSKWTLDPIKDHFAHLRANDSSKIAFIESEEHGIIQKLTALTPGRYITRFYELEDQKMDDAKRRALIAAVDPSGEIFFAKTPDEITYVYKNGPSSCMDGDHNFSHLPVWPVAPYGAGDLAVAYTKNTRGRIQSRALCWPEKKLHGRCYGDIARLRSALAAEGYTDLRDGGDNKVNTFVGARLLKIPNENYDHQYIVPYFDDIGVGVDMGDHFVTADKWEAGKHYVCSSSSGVSQMHARCPKEDVAVYVSDMRFVHGADQLWSSGAIKRHAFTCLGSGKIWSRDYKVTLYDGTAWSKEWFDEHGEHCIYTHSNRPKDEMVQKGDKRMHRSVADEYDDEGNKVEIKPKRRRGSKIVGYDLAVPGGDITVNTTIRGRIADQFIVDDVDVISDRAVTAVNDLILNRSRRVA
ncbi:hypothetical protein [Bradyrhizobium sp. th.b2]|uniref:hypothetical protein n=1 Tax=Bradyrhizobium sp. th-b2 TaxID=172088 RepID=UPI000409A214|nr:hypothetical protein [Bradyrhizobium sp. th.b2]